MVTALGEFERHAFADAASAAGDDDHERFCHNETSCLRHVGAPSGALFASKAWSASGRSGIAWRAPVFFAYVLGRLHE